MDWIIHPPTLCHPPIPPLPKNDHILSQGAEAHGTKFCVECGFKLGSGGGGDDEGGDQARGADSGDYSGQDAHDGYSYYSDEPDGDNAPVDRAPVARRAPRDSPARDQGTNSGAGLCCLLPWLRSPVPPTVRRRSWRQVHGCPGRSRPFGSTLSAGASAVRAADRSGRGKPRGAAAAVAVVAAADGGR